MSSYLLYKSNNALHMLAASLELQIKILNPRSKIIQNVKLLSIKIMI